MTKLILLTVALAVCVRAEQPVKVTVPVNQTLALDEKSKLADVSWNGTELAPVGGARLFHLGKYGVRVFNAIRARSAARATYSPAPIPARLLGPGEIFGVRTNKGNYAKVMVTAAEAGSLTLQYVTFLSTPLALSGSISGPPPYITSVQNNYSYLRPGAPNYGIAPGSIFIVQGQNLSTNNTPVLQSSAAPGLPLTLGQTSLSVTVNGVTTVPALYYAFSTAVAAVLPSNTPAGTGTLTIQSNGQSSQAPIQVVASAMGLDTLYGNGAGAGVATDASSNVLSFSNSARAGQTITLWGSGLGADPSNDDRSYPQGEHNLTSVPLQVYIGGVSASVLYRGRSAYPGLDQINVVIPSNVAPGCFVSVTAQTNLIVSNTVTIPVSALGGACSDPGLGLAGAQLQAFANGTVPVKSIAVMLSEQTSLAGTVSDSAEVIPFSVTSTEFGSGNSYSSQGSCVLFQPGLGFPFQSPLDAGAVQLSGPTGNSTVTNQGFDDAEHLPSGSLAANPGPYTFTSAGGADIGPFKVSLTVPKAFAILNQTALASINRAQGATVSWTGGALGGDVMVNAVAPAPDGGSINVYCHAPSGAGQLTIPPSVLLAIPPGNGKLLITSSTAPETVSATGLDFSVATAVLSYEVFASYK